MLVLILSVVTIVGLLVWKLMSISTDITSNENSMRAIDNIYTWLNAMLGTNWPIVIGFIILLLAIILILLSTSNTTITIEKSSVTLLTKLISILTVTLAALVTWKWRVEYSNQHLEFGIILLMISLNCYLIYKKD